MQRGIGRGQGVTDRFERPAILAGFFDCDISVLLPYSTVAPRSKGADRTP